MGDGNKKNLILHTFVQNKQTCDISSFLFVYQAKCHSRYPPGDEIYRKNGLSIFEVDGKNHKVSHQIRTETMQVLNDDLQVYQLIC